MQEVYRRIVEYNPPEKYTNFCVTYHMATPISLAHPWINGDGLVAQVLLRKILGNTFMSLPTKSPIDLSALKLPLAKSHGCWHCSVSQFNDDARMAMTKIYGRFDSFNIDHAVTKKKRLPIMSGHYKSRMVSLPVMPSKNVKFYARGNIDECKWIFGSVPNLGKDRGKGFGEVISFSIEEIPEDYSLFRDSVVMHPIPISEYHLELLPGTDIKTMNLTYTPPYWDTGRAKPCIAPGSILPKSKKATEDLYFDAVEELNAGSTA